MKKTARSLEEAHARDMRWMRLMIAAIIISAVVYALIVVNPALRLHEDARKAMQQPPMHPWPYVLEKKDQPGRNCDPFATDPATQAITLWACDPEPEAIWLDPNNPR